MEAQKNGKLVLPGSHLSKKSSPWKPAANQPQDMHAIDVAPIFDAIT
jgi:hypothetical protein